MFDDDLYLSEALRQHLDNRGAGDGGPGDWWCAAQRSNGEPIEFMSSEFGRPYEAKHIFAHDIVRGLNRHVGHGGRWITVWTHPRQDAGLVLLNGINYERMHMVWLDQDGDPQFGCINEDNFLVSVREPPEKWLQDGEDGYRMYLEQMRIIDPSPRQLFMAAQGERPPTRVQ